MQQFYGFLQQWHLEVAAVLGCLLDWLLGDPEHWFHPVRLIGGLVERPFPLALLHRGGRHCRFLPHGGTARDIFSARLFI